MAQVVANLETISKGGGGGGGGGDTLKSHYVDGDHTQQPLSRWGHTKEPLLSWGPYLRTTTKVWAHK